MDNKVKIGLQIAKLRKNKGYTQKDLAEMMNVSFQAISKWERGLSLPDLETLHKLCGVFNISFNYFLFDAYSALSFDELIRDVNSNGISGSNYRSVGALVRSKSLDRDIINLFSDEILRNALEIALDEMDELLAYSDIKLDHKIIRIYSDLLSLEIDFNEEVINEIEFKHVVILPSLSNMIYSKTLSRLIENTKDTFYFMILKSEDTIEYRTVCSENLIDKGFNCFFITDLIMKLSLKNTILGSNGGGGQLSHAGFNSRATTLKENFVEESSRILKEYLLNYDKEYKISFS